MWRLTESRAERKGAYHDSVFGRAKETNGKVGGGFLK